MINVEINVVPPGGGEMDYTINVQLPTAPSAGDYISLRRDNGTADFIVRRCWWYLQDREGDRVDFSELVVEAEVAYGLTSDEQHKENVRLYEGRGKAAKRFDSSTY